MKQNIKCFLGFHKWVIKDTSIPNLQEKTCSRCGKFNYILKNTYNKNDDKNDKDDGIDMIMMSCLSGGCAD